MRPETHGRVLSMLACAGVALTACGVARAADVAESETDGAAVNNSIAAAQFINGAAFTAASSGDIFGSLPTASIRGRGGAGDVDFYRFDAAPGIAYFDIDGGSFDTYLALFDSTGTVIGASDDSFPADAGSSSDLDSFLGVFALPGAGTYYIAVSKAGNAPLAAFTGGDPVELFRPDGVFGGHSFEGAIAGDSSYFFNDVQAGLEYTLHVTIPAPGAALAMGAGLALAGRRRR